MDADPPEELCRSIFPWVEEESLAYELRVERYGDKATDYSLKNLLALLKEFRTILLQDGAVLHTKYPNLKLWRYPPFNTPIFTKFSAMSTHIMEKAAAEARHQLEHLPEAISRTMEGVLQTISMKQRQTSADMAAEMDSHNQFLQGLMNTLLKATSKGRRITRDFGKWNI